MAIGTKVNVGMNATPVQRGLAKIQRGFQHMSGRVKAAGRAMAAPFIKLMAVLAPLLTVGAFTRGIKGIVDYGGAISDLAARAGLTAQEIVVLEEVFRRTGLEGKDVATTLQRLGKNLKYGLELPTSEAGRAMAILGVEARNLEGLSLAEQFEMIGKKIGSMRDSGLQARAAMALFGREGALLVNTFKTSGAFDVARKSVGKLGANLDEMAGSFDHISDALGSIGLKFRQFFAGAAAEMLPTLTAMADRLNQLDLSDIGAGFGKFFNTIRGAFQEGNFGGLVAESLIYAVKMMGQELLALVQFAGEKFSNAVVDNVAKSELGAKLGLTAGTGFRGTYGYYRGRVAMEDPLGLNQTRDRLAAEGARARSGATEARARRLGLHPFASESEVLERLKAIERNTAGRVAIGR